MLFGELEVPGRACSAPRCARDSRAAAAGSACSWSVPGLQAAALPLQLVSIGQQALISDLFLVSDCRVRTFPAAGAAPQLREQQLHIPRLGNHSNKDNIHSSSQAGFH